MHRFPRVLVASVMAFSMMGADASAQWGFDGWGWMGWGVQDAEGSALQGAGFYAMGAGLYNLNTAKANSIDMDTAIRFNDYVATITIESARRYAARRDDRIAKNRALFDARQKQLRDSPSQRDIDNGDALNAAVVDLSDPRLGRSALRAAKAPIPANVVADIPFLSASDRVTLMLDDLRSAVKWSDVFEEERFASDKKTFDDLVARLKAEADEGELSPRILQEAARFVSELRAKVDAQPLKDPHDQSEAIRFITTCESLLGLLKKPNLGPAILELRKVENTMIGNLLGFMHAHNLRFGPATTPRQRQIYTQLFTILDQTRDQILAEVKLDNTPAPKAGATDAENFYEMLQKANARTGK